MYFNKQEEKAKHMKACNSLFDFLGRHKKTLLLIFVVSTSTLLISSAISIWLSDFHNLTVPTVGTIKTIGVEAYWDQDTENKTETINWDTMWPGLTKNFTLYIRSVSNVKTVLHMNITNVTPSPVSEYLNVTWNYNGAILNPDEVIEVTLFLSASNDVSFTQYLITNKVTDFNFEIHFVAHE